MLSAKSNQTNQLKNSSGFSLNQNQGDTQENLKITLKMIAALVILISANLVLPRLAEITENWQTSKNYIRPTIEVGHQELLEQGNHNPHSDKYEPPNFGAPESNRGSGTR